MDCEKSETTVTREIKLTQCYEPVISYVRLLNLDCQATQATEASI